MKVKLGQLHGIYEALVTLKGQKLPIKGKYWVNKNFKRVAKEYGDAEENRQSVIEKYCKKDLEGKPVRLFMTDAKYKGVEYRAGDPVPAGYLGQFRYDIEPTPEFVKEYNDLMEIDIELDVTPIPIDFLEGAVMESDEQMDALDGILVVEG